MASATRVVLAATLVLAASVVAAPAADDEAESALDRLQAWLDGAETLTARFEQSLVADMLGGEVRESGRLYLRRPGYMRWDYEDPERKSALVLDGDTLLYLEDEGQLIRGRLDSESGLLPDLLAGDGRLRELFVAEIAGVEGRDTLLRLVPRSSEEALESVTLTLRRRDSAIERAEVLDPAGNRMRYRFLDLRVNRRLPDGIFDLRVPPGTEIVGRP